MIEIKLTDNLFFLLVCVTRHTHTHKHTHTHTHTRALTRTHARTHARAFLKITIFYIVIHLKSITYQNR